MPAVLPTTDVRNMLSTTWNVSSITLPVFVIPNDPNTPIRQDLRANANPGDRIIIRPDAASEEEIPIGTWIYGNRIYKIVLELRTNVNRQRLWDLKDEIRRICHNQMHLLTNFQRVQYKNFVEMVEEQQNIWTGRVQLELVNSAVLLEI